MQPPADHLVFVYNVDSGAGALLLDAVHRVVSPSTYACTLCDLTYGHFTMKRDWKEFIGTLRWPVTFLMRDDFLRRHPESKGATFPAVFLIEGGAAREVVAASAIDAADDLGALKVIVGKALASIA